MSTSKALVWDEDAKRLYEAGVSKGVLFKMSNAGNYNSGVAWDGLTKVDEKPTGGEGTAIYANNKKYGEMTTPEEFEISIEAYVAPDEFDACDGQATIAKGVTVSQQERSRFGLCFRTEIGNDTEGTNYGYKLHFVYGAKVAPSQRSHESVGESTEASKLSWDAKTTPVEIPGFKPSASLVVNSTKADPAKLAELEAKVYGSETAESTLPTVSEIITMMGPAVVEQAEG